MNGVFFSRRAWNPLLFIASWCYLFPSSLSATPSFLQTPLSVQAEYALMEEDTLTASLILHYLNDHPNDESAKTYSTLRLASISQEQPLTKHSAIIEEKQDLLRQLIFSYRSLLKVPSRIESAHSPKTSHLTNGAISYEQSQLEQWMVSVQSQLPSEPYTFLQHFYLELTVLWKQVCLVGREQWTKNTLTKLLLQEMIDQLFFSTQTNALFDYYTDYRKHMAWLRLKQIEISFYETQLDTCPSSELENQLIEAYDVFFFLQTKLSDQGLFSIDRKIKIRKQFKVETKALLLYEDLYCRTGDSRWQDKMLQVVENMRSSLLLNRQPFYLSRGLSDDLARYLLSAIAAAQSKPKGEVEPLDTLDLIGKHQSLTTYRQTFYRLHDLEHQVDDHNRMNVASLCKLSEDQSLAIAGFFDATHHWFAYCFQKGKMEWQFIPKSTHLQEAIDDLETHCSQPAEALQAKRSWIQEFSAPAYTVYHHLLHPFFQENIPDQLIIIPDGLLGRLPFEALLTQPLRTTEGLSYLVQQSAIRYYPTLKLLSAYEMEEPFKVEALHTHLADYRSSMGSAHTPQWASLPGGAEELAAIARHFPTRINTTSSPLQLQVADSKQQRLLHLASHAVLQSAPYHEPTLILSSDSTHWWPMHQLASQPNQYPVVVLSACETGRGRAVPGEGIQSIGQQFLQTGSRSTLQSLSKVADASTARLIDHWYAALKTKLESGRALQESKIRFLQQADPFYQHPYFWSGFVTYGQRFRIDL